MKLLYDQNLSHHLVKLLSFEYPGSEHVRNVGLATSSDSAIWADAKTNGFVIVSKDTDFEQRALLMGHPPKVVWIRLGNCPTSAVETLLRARHSDMLAFETDPAAS